MNALRLVAAGWLILGLTSVGTAEVKKDDKKATLVGSWTVAKAEKGTLPEGSVLEFAKDGKFTVTIKGEPEKLEGTYKVDGEKLVLTMKKGGEEMTRPLTVKKLTADDLILLGPDGKTVEFKVKK